MSELQHAREVLARHRASVLTALRRNARERDALLDKRAALLRDGAELLAEGREAGCTITEMAEAYGVSRQMVHQRLRGTKEAG